MTFLRKFLGNSTLGGKCQQICSFCVLRRNPLNRAQFIPALLGSRPLGLDLSLVLPNKKTREEKMDRFMEDQNVLLYRRLRNSSTGETERRAIMKLLAEVWDDFKYQLQQDKLGKSVRESKPVKRWH